jgi:GT2 family glycosyltransferase
MELVVVDDGAAKAVGSECEAYGARVVHHGCNRGLGQARNTGVAATTAPIVAFTDDDCIPRPDWAERLLEAYDDPTVIAAGGDVRPWRLGGFLLQYYQANNPLAPLEADLARSSALSYRLWLYLLHNLVGPTGRGRRAVYSLVGANCSFRTPALEAVGGFDAGIRFGGEDSDVFYRLRAMLPEARLEFVPEAVVAHDFDPSLRDALRRARSYGRGNARNWAKHSAWGPTVYPAPFLWLLFLLIARHHWSRAPFAVAFPLLIAPRWLLEAVRRRSLVPLGFAYLQILQEAVHNVGFLPDSARYWRSGLKTASEAVGNDGASGAGAPLATSLDCFLRNYGSAGLDVDAGE